MHSFSSGWQDGFHGDAASHPGYPVACYQKISINLFLDLIKGFMQ
jgi:hypothetical protein